MNELARHETTPAALEALSAEGLAAFFDIDLVTAAAMQRTRPATPVIIDSVSGVPGASASATGTSAAAAGACLFMHKKAAARLAREIAQVRSDGAELGFAVRSVTCAIDHVSVVASLRGPAGSPFEGGAFVVRFRFEAAWPLRINRRTFFAHETPIRHHPDILPSGRIDCIEFGDHWIPGRTLMACLIIAQQHLGSVGRWPHGPPAPESAHSEPELEGGACLGVARGGGMRALCANPYAGSLWLANPAAADAATRRRAATHAAPERLQAVDAAAIDAAVAELLAC